MGDQVVEARFDAGLHDLTEDQISGLLQAFDADWEISVGLVYGGGAGVVVLNVPASDADHLAERVATKARALGLTVTVVETLGTAAYEERALAEDVS